MAAFALGLSSSRRRRERCPIAPSGGFGSALMMRVAVSSFWINQVKVGRVRWARSICFRSWRWYQLPLGVWMAHRHQVSDSSPHHDFRFSRVRWSSPGCSHYCRDGSCTRSCLVIEKRCRNRGVSGAETGAASEVPTTGSVAAQKSPVGLVSLWKNEGKNHRRKSFRGGLEGPDTLYNSELKLTGFPLCLNLKIRSPESRRRPRTFVPYPSSTR